MNRDSHPAKAFKACCMALVLSACGGSGGGAVSVELPSTMSIIEPPPSPPDPPPPDPPPPPPEPTPPPPQTVFVIDTAAAPQHVSGIYRALGSSIYRDSRKRLAERSASNTQGTQQGVVTELDGRHRGNLLGLNGVFTLTSSHGWRLETEPSCACSIHTRALFYDEEGYELMSLVNNPGNLSLSTPLAGEAVHGFVQGAWHDGDGRFAFFSDGTRPDRLRAFGSASYVGSMYGMLVMNDGETSHREASVPLSMTVTWGDSPSLQGTAGNFNVYSVSIASSGPMVHAEFQETLNSTMMVSGGNWHATDKAFHDGTIGCLGGCVTGSNYRGVWNAHFVDTGSGAVDPFILSGTFGLHDFLLDGQSYDFIGFLQGNTPRHSHILRRGHGMPQHSPGRALATRLAYNVLGGLGPGLAGHEFTTQDAMGRLDLIMSAASIATQSQTVGLMDSNRPGAAPLFVNPGYTINIHWYEYPELVWAETGFEVGSGRPLIAGNATIRPPLAGHASYSGYAGGYYTSGSQSGSFVSTVELTVDFKMDGPEIDGGLGYDFGGVTGILRLSGGTWDTTDATFRDGAISCRTGCVTLGDVASWSANMIEITGNATTSLDAAEGMTGKFGAASISLENNGGIYDVLGVFAAVTDMTARAEPARATYFPALVTDFLKGSVHASANLNRYAEESNNYYRRIVIDQVHNTITSPSSPNRRIMPTVVSSDNNFVDAGGTLQLATDMWDWRTGDPANCYCTMFIIGHVYDSNARRLPMWLSASPTLLTKNVDYSDARHGWVGGLWRRDSSPDRWHSLSDSGMGIFIDGTSPVTLPTEGSMSFTGQALGVAQHPYYNPRQQFYPRESGEDEILEGAVNLNVQWGTEKPSISGGLELYYYFEGAYIKMSLRDAVWSASKKRFSSGEVICVYCFNQREEVIGTWEGLFVDTGDDLSNPGGFAGAFAIASVIVEHERTSFYLPLREFFGWFWADSCQSDNVRNCFLNMPGNSALLGYQEGFGTEYAAATPEQRLAASFEQNDHGRFISLFEDNTYGYNILTANGNDDWYVYTRFWKYDNYYGYTLGVSHTSSSVAVPTSGNANYQGNAAGIYADSQGGNGVFHGAVSLSLQFAMDGVSAMGKLSLDLNGEWSGFDMSLGNNASEGSLVCMEEDCSGGTNRWGGSLWHTSDELAPGEIPDAYLGEFQLHGVTIGNTSYDALGMFAAVSE